MAILVSKASEQSKTGIVKSRPKKSGKRRKQAAHICRALLLPVIFLIAWQIVSVKEVFPPIFIPSVKSVFLNFVDQLQSGLLLSDLRVSLFRVLQGYAIGALLGIGLGILMGISATVNELFYTLLNGIRQIPGLAWIPLFIVWFGIGNTTKLVLVAKGTFFPVLINTIDGVQSTNKGLLELSKLYHVSKFELVGKIYFLSALPHIFTGLRLGAGVAWMSVVAAEMFASMDGVGYRIVHAQTMMLSDMLVVDMIVIGVVGGVMDFGLRRLIDRLTRWQRA